MTEQALEGEGFDWQQFWGKTSAGAKLGATSALSGSATAGMAGILGEGTTLTGQALRGVASGYAGGASGSGLGAALEGKSLWEVAKESQLGGLEGAIGGAFGGASSQLTQGRGVVVRMGIETVGGGLSSGLGAYITGRSPEEIAQAVLIGSITSAAVEIGAPRVGKPKTSGGLPKPAAWEIVGEDVDYGIIIFKSGEDYVGVHPDHPETVFIPQGNLPPKVFARNPDGAIVEVPWPFNKRPTAEEQTFSGASSTLEARVSKSGELPNARISSQQMKDETAFLRKHSELIKGEAPSRRAEIGEHEWREEPDGIWCRHSNGKPNCVESSEIKPTDEDLEEARIVGKIFPYTLIDWGTYIYHSRQLGIVQTFDGPQAWYIRTGEGGEARPGDPDEGEPARFYGCARLQAINEFNKSPIPGKTQKWFIKPGTGGRMGEGNKDVFNWLKNQEPAASNIIIRRTGDDDVSDIRLVNDLLRENGIEPGEGYEIGQEIVLSGKHFRIEEIP